MRVHYVGQICPFRKYFKYLPFLKISPSACIIEHTGQSLSCQGGWKVSSMYVGMQVCMYSCMHTYIFKRNTLCHKWILIERRGDWILSRKYVDLPYIVVFIRALKDGGFYFCGDNKREIKQLFKLVEKLSLHLRYHTWWGNITKNLSLICFKYGRIIKELSQAYNCFCFTIFFRL